MKVVVHSLASLEPPMRVISWRRRLKQTAESLIRTVGSDSDKSSYVR
jgi:uncharacterized membrane protein